MNIEVGCKEDIAFLKLLGELDMSTVNPLKEEFLKIKDEYKKVVFDFSEVAFVDSTGVGSIIKLLHDNSKVKYAITNLQDDVQEIFDILNLQEILGEDVFIASNQEAVRYLNNQ